MTSICTTKSFNTAPMSRGDQLSLASRVSPKAIEHASERSAIARDSFETPRGPGPSARPGALKDDSAPAADPAPPAEKKETWGDWIWRKIDGWFGDFFKDRGDAGGNAPHTNEDAARELKNGE